MARLILFTLLVVCLCFIAQTTAMPKPQTDSTNIANGFQQAWDGVRGGFEDFMKNEKVNDFFQSGKEFFQKAADTVRQEAEKMMPQKQ